MKDFYYRKLDAYQLAKQLTIVAYKLLKGFRDYERFALCEQIRRAAISIPSNIAEGTGRFSLRDRARFLDISYGSLCETVCQFEIALELNYISDSDFLEFEQLASRTSMTILGLKKNYEMKNNNIINQQGES